MYQDEEEKELEASGFRISDDGDEEPLELGEEDLDFGVGDDDPEDRFH